LGGPSRLPHAHARTACHRAGAKALVRRARRKPDHRGRQPSGHGVLALPIQGAFDIAYLDPPYNTGKKDFPYSDRRFHDPNADADDAVYVSNEDGGRHTKWLNFIGPRLWLVWQLLAEHGICFISINDVELYRLGMLMDEIFGERNRLGIVVWKQAVLNNPTRISIEHEYILCYAKRIEAVPETWQGPSPAKEWLLKMYEGIREKEADPPAIEKLYSAAIREQKAKHK
jgi:adenine-specific DNA-methyltransferase